MANPLLARCLLLGFSAVSVLAQPRAIEMEDMFRLKRVSDPQIAPDGKGLAYVVTEVMKSENRLNSDIWWVAVASPGGPQADAAPRKLTNSPQHDRHPRWSPDGRWIAFESTRDGTPQIFLLSANGGEARKLTTLFSGASQPQWAPDGKSMAFVSAVFPEFSARPFKDSDKANREKQEARDRGKVKARVIDQLLYRHWDEWVDGKRQHVFVVGVNPDGAAAGEPRDVTPGENDAVPTSSTFSGGDDFAFSPDSREIAFTAPPLPIREQAWSTNHDVWTVDLSTGKRTQRTMAPGADGLPRYSPDGTRIAYRAQARAGFEADKWDLWLLDRATGQRRNLTGRWPGSVNSYAWSPDGRSILLEAQENGAQPIWRVEIPSDSTESDERNGVTRLFDVGVNQSLSVSPDGQWVAFAHHRFDCPPEIHRYRIGDTSPAPVTRTNREQLDGIELNPAESVIVPGAGGARVQMWIVKPPRFDPGKKYPLVFWVHGGPQSAFLNSWSTRWNPQLWAAQGYVIALPNPRGSTGFGQAFTDAISRDWGGKVIEDLMACLAHLEKQPYIDATRMAAAGASFGGYVMNWFQGHTDKFKTLVTHGGVYDFTSMYGTTEETWFAEWDTGIPWEDAEYDRFSPHRFAQNFKTPNLVIHNELDFRVPLNQGLSLFTTLQRRSVPSRLLVFPDEGHWVLKPQNSELWHTTIFDWLTDHLKR
jgi:dipeptidyl aminopeptidase/acylaminoacyl peptidase